MAFVFAAFTFTQQLMRPSGHSFLSVLTVVACGCGLIDASGDKDAPETATVTVDTASRFQVMTGWEATSQSAEAHPDFERFKDSLFDEAVKLGINRVRLEIRAGFENPVDYFQGKDAEQRCHRWLTINDNDDPLVINPAGFQFSSMDSSVARTVLPLKKRLEARGERLFINLNYTAFLNQCPPPTYVHGSAAEYAEFILATFLHLRATFGVVPDAVEIILEPDNVSAWRSGRRIGEAIVATAGRLAAAGFNPEFIAPSNTDLSAALEYAEDIYRVPGTQALLKELAYHRYRGVSTRRLESIAQLAKSHNARTAMLEHIGSDADDLYTDLTVANVSAWQQYTLAYPTVDNGAQYFRIVDGKVVMGERTRYLRQYFHYVRLGAQRVAAESSTSDVRAVGFQNADGRLAVIMHVPDARRVEVRGLAPGNYGVSATTTNLTGSELGDQAVPASGMLTVAVPAAGVVTVYRK